MSRSGILEYPVRAVIVRPDAQNIGCIRQKKQAIS